MQGVTFKLCTGCGSSYPVFGTAVHLACLTPYSNGVPCSLSSCSSR